MGTVIQAGHIFSGGTIVSIPPAGGDSTLYYLVSSHLPSDYAVYLYDSSGNELVRIPKPNDASDSWGNNIGTNDTKIAITDNDGNGALYIYDMDGSNMVKVTSSDASGNDRFGSQLEINSTKIIVGAPYAPLGSANYVGAVYVYDLDGTNEVKITASDASYGDNFSGWASLSVSESKIFVGSGPHDNNRGALYIYDMDGSNEVKVQPSDNAQNDQFGYVVAASETKVVATSFGSGAHGAAYIFDHDGTNEVKIEPSVDSRNNAFGGASAAINDTHVVISDRAFNGQKGAIYIYNIDGTNEVRIEHPSNFSPYDYFGYNLAMSSSKVFTCPPNDDDGGTSTGNVYEYNLDGTGERTLPTPSTFAAGSRFGQGLYIYDSSLVPSVPSGPTFIAPLSTTTSYLALGDPHYKNSSNQSVGGVYIYNQSDMSAPVTILEGVMYSDSGINYGIHLGSSILLTDTHIIVGNSVNHNETSTPVNSSGKTPRIMIWSLDDLSSPPTTIFHPLGSTAKRFGTFEGTLMVMGDKLFLQGANDNDTNIYVYDLTDLSANPIEITPNLSGWNIGSFGDSFDIDPVSKKLYVGCWSSMVDGATYQTLDYSSGIVLVYDVSDLSSNINTHTATILNTDIDRDWNDKFGSCVRYHNGKLFIGHLANGNRKENLYVYDTSDLSFIQKFSAENIGQYGWGSNFAAWPRSVYVSDKGVVLGAPTSSPNEDDYSTGEVFVIPMDSSGNLGTLTKLSNSGLSVADGDRLGEHVTSFGDKIYATHKGSSGNNMKTVEWSWSNLSSNGSELSIVDPRTTFDHSGFYTTGMGVSPVPSLPAFIAPSTTSSTVANRLFMFSSDYANSIYTTNGVDNNGSTSHGGLLMTDASFANPLTLSSKSPQSVAGGEGKVVSIDYQGEISVYDSSTGALETTFNDTLLDNAKASSLQYPANSCVIGAGKIFINSHEHNPNGVGSIIVVDLLDRNVPSFLITPALGNYSRLGHQSYGKIQFIDGKIHAGTSQFSSGDMGIHSFDPDGSNHTFIPTTFAPHSIVKFGDNYAVANEDHGVEIISPTGQVLHSKKIGSYGFGRDIDVTSTNKLVVRRHISQYNQAVYIYDEGFTNEIIISHDDQPNTSGGTTPVDSLWLSEARENSGGLQTINGDILVAAPNASSDTVNQSGAIYRYNDSGVLQEIFYGTVASQRLGTDITVGTETTTTALPTFIAPPTAVDSGSIRFDGNSVIKVGSDNSLWNIDTNQAFCMEAFVKLDDVDGGTGYQNIFSTWESSNSYNGFMLHIASGGQIFWIMNGMKNVMTSAVINADNTWYHVAVTRNSGSSIKIFVNGNQVGSLTAGTAVNGGAPLYLGANMDGSSSNGQYRPTGNISNYRITIGEQVYSENFTPSTTNLSLTSQGVSESNVKLLAGQSNTDWTQTNQTTSNITLTAQAGSPTSSTINPFPTP